MKHFASLFTWSGLLLLAIALFPDNVLAGGAVGDGLPMLFAGTIALDGVFKTRALVVAINKMRPFSTRALDLIFSRKKRQLSGLFAWDIKSSSERLLKNIRVAEPAQVRDGVGRKTVTCESPRFAEKRFIAAGDLDAARKAGELGPEIMKERVADEQFDMRGSVDRTREFMAVKCLSGQVVDESGSVIVDYNFPAAQKPVLAGAALWTDAAGDPIKNIRAWKKYIGDRVGVDKFVAICGSGAMDALIANAKVGDKLKYAAGKQIAEEGRVAFLAGVSIDEYFGSYKDAAGDRQQMVPDDVFILVGLGPEVAAELYAPVIDLKAEGGVGSGKEAEIFFSKSWEVEDPSGRWVKAEARPLPVLFQPECVIYAKVI